MRIQAAPWTRSELWERARLLSVNGFCVTYTSTYVYTGLDRARAGNTAFFALWKLINKCHGGSFPFSGCQDSDCWAAICFIKLPPPGSRHHLTRWSWGVAKSSVQWVSLDGQTNKWPQTRLVPSEPNNGGCLQGCHLFHSWFTVPGPPAGSHTSKPWQKRIASAKCCADRWSTGLWRSFDGVFPNHNRKRRPSVPGRPGYTFRGHCLRVIVCSGLGVL